MADIEDSADVAQDEGAEPDETAQAVSDNDIHKEALARIALAEEAETEIRKLAKEDLEFRAGKQWPDDIQQERQRDGRPCLVINRLPQFVQQVSNDQRQNRPAIKVHPVDDGADADTAKIIQGLIRHIEYNSNAEVAYDTAFESAATGGFGYFRIITDFVDSESFEQEILIKRIRNPFAVFFDPYAQEPDGSDANWAFVVDDYSRDEYKSKFPDSKLASRGMDWDAIGNSQPDWVKADTVRVAEYFYKEMQDVTIHLLSTGETVRDEKLQERLAAAAQSGIQATVVKSRQTKIPVISWCKMNGIEILEKTTWPGTYIPIIPVYGAEIWLDGKRILEGIIRNAKDSQRMYNYWASAETEAIALAPRTPFLVAEGQIEGHEEAWKTANRRNHAYLQYKMTGLNGQMAPPPQRQAFEPAIQAITNARMISADDMKATTGIYDPSLGKQSAETSGIAIQRRNNQAQTSNFHFVDNLTRSLRHTGRVLVDLLPKIYDTARAARIIGEDGEQKVVRINQPFKDESGKDVLYSMDAGRYDVTVDTGPNYASKRQEAAASMLDLSRSIPQVMQVAADLIVKNMDWPGAQDIAERIKKTLPPGIADDPKAQQIPPQVKAQMQQMGQMVDQLTHHLNDANHLIETKKLELESRERIEMAKLQVQAEIKMAELGSREDLAVLKHEIDVISSRLNILDYSAPIGANEPSNFAPQADGAESAGPAEGAPEPTGGPSPGSPMEGNSP